MEYKNLPYQQLPFIELTKSLVPEEKSVDEQDDEKLKLVVNN